MIFLLKTREEHGEPKAYDQTITIDNPLFVVPSAGEKFFFMYDKTPIVFYVISRTFELTVHETDDGLVTVYDCTLWGRYAINVEGQQEDIL